MVYSYCVIAQEHMSFEAPSLYLPIASLSAGGLWLGCTWISFLSPPVSIYNLATFAVSGCDLTEIQSEVDVVALHCCRLRDRNGEVGEC